MTEYITEYANQRKAEPEEKNASAPAGTKMADDATYAAIRREVKAQIEREQAERAADLESAKGKINAAAAAKTPEQEKLDKLHVFHRNVTVACIVVGVAIVIIALAVTLSGNKKRETAYMNQVKVACDFLNFDDVTACQATQKFDGQANKYSNRTITKGNTIPSEIGVLTQLTYLDLADRQLRGTIPSTLGRLFQLNTLYLYENLFVGTIPSTLGNLGQLEELELSENQLTGTIPFTLGNLGQLEYLGLEDNQLTGTIPSELGYLGKLEGLFLSNNTLRGAIPSTLGYLTELTYMDLSINQLYGTIPATLFPAYTKDFYIDCAEVECTCCKDGDTGSDCLSS